jgi:hypothetical protein
MTPHDFDLPHPVLTRIGDDNTEPTFATILITHIELNANAASIYSTRGDGVHGHLALAINVDDYKQRSIGGVDFQVPTAPPSFTAHKVKSANAEIVEDNCQHEALLAEFILWHKGATLHNLLIAAVPAIFLAAKRNPVTGFGDVSCLFLLSHLCDVYGCTTEKELEQNVQHMRTPWHPLTAIRSLFSKLNMGLPSRSKVRTNPPSPPSYDGHTR